MAWQLVLNKFTFIFTFDVLTWEIKKGTFKNLYARNYFKVLNSFKET